MPITPLFPLPEGLEIASISDTPEELLICVTSHRPSSLCPLCLTPSSAIHSDYCRHPRDLPCAGRPIRLVLTVRKFFCRNPHCCRKVFTERLPDFIAAYSRLTKRLRTAVQEIGFATCGKGGERLGDKLGMGFSDATVLWSLFLVPLPKIGQVHIIGVDDWSWRRGKRFGSILVNLETHKIVDLLADREAESVRQWLAAHPEVDVVSRDRGGVYIDGASARSTTGNAGGRPVAHPFEFGRCRRSVLDSRAYSPGTWESLVREVSEARPPSVLFFCHSWLPTQVAGTSLTQIEIVSEGTGTACSWDEPAQDRGRTGSRS